MRSITLFAAGLAVGLAVQVGVAQSSNKGVQMMNHVGVTVPNVLPVGPNLQVLMHWPT